MPLYAGSIVRWAGATAREHGQSSGRPRNIWTAAAAFVAVADFWPTSRRRVSEGVRELGFMASPGASPPGSQRERGGRLSFDRRSTGFPLRCQWDSRGMSVDRPAPLSVDRCSGGIKAFADLGSRSDLLHDVRKLAAGIVVTATGNSSAAARSSVASAPPSSAGRAGAGANATRSLVNAGLRTRGAAQRGNRRPAYADSARDSAASRLRGWASTWPLSRGPGDAAS